MAGDTVNAEYCGQMSSNFEEHLMHQNLAMSKIGTNVRFFYLN